jgi:hypothetical protein
MKALLSSFLLLPLLSCSNDAPAPTEQPGQGPVETMVMTAQCGCTLDSVGHCGNYIEVDGAFVEISNWKELGLGSMEWCAVKGPVAVMAAGEMQDGKFVASAINSGQ